MSAEKRKPALTTPVLKNEKAEAGKSTPSAPVTLLATAAVDVDDDEQAEIAGHDSAYVLPLGVSERQAARVRLFMAEKRRLALEGNVPEMRPCVRCGWPTVPEEFFCRSCWRERKRVKQLLARWGPNVFDDYPRLRVQVAPAVVVPAKPSRPGETVNADLVFGPGGAA